MTTFRETFNTYKSGDKTTAYALFLIDPNSNEGISFERFCEWMDEKIALS